MALIQRNCILGLLTGNEKLHHSKLLKGVFGDPAALELFAFIGRRQIQTDETHSIQVLLTCKKEEKHDQNEKSYIRST